MKELLYLIIFDALIWGTLIWYFARGKKTNGIIMFIMLTFLMSFMGAALIVAIHTFM